MITVADEAGRPHDAAGPFPPLRALSDDVRYELTLFVSGASELAARAVANARLLCETLMVGRYSLAVIDVHDDPGALVASRVLATPTLVKSLPLPVRRVVGDLSQTERVVRILDLPGPGASRAGC